MSSFSGVAGGILLDLYGGTGVATKLTMHVCCGSSPVAHGQDDSCSTTNDVAAGEDFGARGLHAVVDNNSVFTAEGEPGDGGGHEGIGRYAYGDNYLVDVECFCLPGDGLRTASTAGVGLAQFHYL